MMKTVYWFSFCIKSWIRLVIWVLILILEIRDPNYYVGRNCYIDLNYYECYILENESDVYFFGMILFEILVGY